MSGNLRIFIVDDHPTTRAGISAILQERPGTTMCGEAGSYADGLEAILREEPELVVTDFSLPDRTGLELMKSVHEIKPDIKFLFVSMHDEMLFAERVLSAGARGFVPKLGANEMLRSALDRVMAGGIFLSEDAASHVMEGMTRTGRDRLPFDTLTDREQEVFLAIGKGKTIKEIAVDFKLSPKTIETHRERIKRKLSIKDTTTLMKRAVEFAITGKAGDS